MSTEQTPEMVIHISDDQLERIVARMKIHACRFDEVEAKRIHRFTDMMDDEGIENVREVIALGAWIKVSKKTGNAVFITALIVACLGAFWAGAKALFKAG